MTNSGDDCYFFYYSTCAKGDSCQFRHCQAAMGSETVCSLWQEGRCFRMVCKFRHMEIKKNRREIACYWENQPAGCQKAHCAFHHEKPRFIDGQFVPVDKGSVSKEVEQAREEPAPPPPPAPLPSAANPQLRGVIKAETQESVPSSTHLPVVINPADDDDQCSEDEASPRKLAKVSSSGYSLNFGIRTLDEIRPRRALKASMKRYGIPLDETTLSGQVTNGAAKQEGMSPYGGLVLSAASDIAACRDVTGRRNLTDRLGKRIHRTDCELPLKRQLPSGAGVRVKTLEEFRREKAARMQAQSQGEDEGEAGGKVPRKPHLKRTRKPASPGGSSNMQKSSGPAERPGEPTITTEVKVCGASGNGVKVKTFQEIMREKKLRKQEDQAASGSPSDSSLGAEPSLTQPTRSETPAIPRKVRVLDSTLLTKDGTQHEALAPATGAKVRPKLNVKPSVVKPAAQVKPGQKRKAAESAVAEVKPLNSGSRSHDHMPSKRAAVSLQVATPSSPEVPAPLAQGPSPGLGPLDEELLAAHTLNTALPGNTAPSRDACTVPQRLHNVPFTMSSGLDTFEDLMNEFIGYLEDEEQDQGKTWDDLLRELLEMIDN